MCWRDRLFEQHHAGQLMRQVAGPKANARTRLVRKLCATPSGPDHKDQVGGSSIPPGTNFARTSAAEALALSSKSTRAPRDRDQIGERDRFAQLCAWRFQRAAFLDFADFDFAQPELAPGLGRARAISARRARFGARFHAHGEHGTSMGAISLACDRRGRPPTFFPDL